jgi:predicted DsbA family dithiol-disulfide isomerase
MLFETIDKIKIDIISDVSCPWCAIGYKRLEQALRELGVEDRFEIEWHPFELNPSIKNESQNIIKYMSQKYNMSTQEVEKYHENLKDKFHELGMVFHFYEGKCVANTRYAHILLDYAKKQNKQTELKMALFDTYFGTRKVIWDKKVLQEIVQSVGLDVTQAMALLDDTSMQEAIQAKEAYWVDKGISAVPTMIFNDKTMMNGAYPVATYKQLLLELLGHKTI